MLNNVEFVKDVLPASSLNLHNVSFVLGQNTAAKVERVAADLSMSVNELANLALADFVDRYDVERRARSAKIRENDIFHTAAGLWHEQSFEVQVPAGEGEGDDDDEQEQGKVRKRAAGRRCRYNGLRAIPDNAVSLCRDAITFNGKDRERLFIFDRVLYYEKMEKIQTGTGRCVKVFFTSAPANSGIIRLYEGKNIAQFSSSKLLNNIRDYFGMSSRAVIYLCRDFVAHDKGIELTIYNKLI